MTNTINTRTCVTILVCCILLYGISACSKKKPDPTPQQEAVEQGLLPPLAVKNQPPDTMSLEERMKYYQVPGLSIAVLNNNTLEWAQGYGIRENGAAEPVTTDTLFQAASISKLLTALTVLSLIKDGQLQLDADVNTWLTSWRVPENEFTLEQAVTLRQLLSHSAGVTVAEFPGYTPDQTLPSLPQILDGRPPANTSPVEIIQTPGTQWAYSGGGYVIIQQLLEDLSGNAFSKLVDKQIFSPLKLTQSSFTLPLPASLAKTAASGHYGNARPLKGKWRLYPEAAAAGLWSTPSDLAKIIEEIQQASAGKSSEILSSTLSKSLFTPQIGNSAFVGPIKGEGDARWFSSGGSTMGYRSFMVFFPERGQGAIIMTNSDNGHYLAMEIMRGIAHVYEWPDFHPHEKSTVNVSSDTLAEYAGMYEIVGSPGTFLRVNVGEKGLLLNFFNQNFVMYPESEVQFFETTSGLMIRFNRNAEGRVEDLLLSSPLTTRPWRAKKKTDDNS